MKGASLPARRGRLPRREVDGAIARVLPRQSGFRDAEFFGIRGAQRTLFDENQHDVVRGIEGFDKRVTLATCNREATWKVQRGAESYCQYPGITECWNPHWLVIGVGAAEGQPCISLRSRELGHKRLATGITDKKFVVVQEANVSRS